MKNNKIDNQKLFDFWNKHKELSSLQKTKLYNKENATSYNTRTLQQRYSHYASAIEYIISKSKKDILNESYARRELNIMKQQKKTTLMKQELHKAAKKEALSDLLREAIKETIPMPKFSRKTIVKPNGKKIIEYVIADIQYKGGQEEANWVNNIFENLIANIPEDCNKDTEHRLVFLGDDIEGDGAHESQLLEIQKTKVNQARELAPILIRNINEFFSHITKGDKSLAFVPYSNHGMAGGKGKGRYQFPDDDLGLIIYDMIKMGVNKDIFIYKVNHTKFLVETPDTIYLHGHQGYVKSKLRMYETLGNDKRISMGHLHHYEEVEEGGTLLTKYGSCRSKRDVKQRRTGRYEDMAGFYPNPQVTIRVSEGNTIATKRIMVDNEI